MMYFISRGQEKRFESVKKMYEDNVALVKAYEGLAKTLHDTVVYNTSTMTEVKDITKNNLYCPLVRRETKPKEEIRG